MKRWLKPVAVWLVLTAVGTFAVLIWEAARSDHHFQRG